MERSHPVEQLIQRYTDAWASRDPDAIVALHTEDTTFHAHAGQDPSRGKAAVWQAFSDLLAQFPDLTFDAVSQRIGPDFWVAEWRMTGTLAGTDSAFEVDLVDVVTVEDGMVKSKDSYIDAVSMQAQLGMAVAQ
jgi:steroid delta-isomerase-like uncharacterized protein